MEKRDIPHKPWKEYTEDELDYFRHLGLEKMNTPEAQQKARETRQRKKNLRDLTRFMLEADLDSSDEVKEFLEARGFEASEQGAMIYALVNKAKTGDVEAFKTLRDTSGQKPVDGLQVGNLDEDPLNIDLRTLPTSQLLAMINKRVEEEE